MLSRAALGVIKKPNQRYGQAAIVGRRRVSMPADVCVSGLGAGLLAVAGRGDQARRPSASALGLSSGFGPIRGAKSRFWRGFTSRAKPR